jgi:hypothetical protein
MRYLGPRRLVLSLAFGLLAALAAAGSAAASHPYPIGASPLRASLLPALEPCTAPNAKHGPPVDKPSCFPPEQTSRYLTVGTPEANGLPNQSIGFLRMVVFYCPQCVGPVTEDLRLTVQITDVRRKDDLQDYTGKLEAKVMLRMTDHYNSVIGAPPPECSGTTSCPGTVVDFPFRFPVGCTPTNDPTIGSTCAVHTSANAVIPGIVQDRKRASWQLGDVEIFDGGADGDPATPDNTLFEVQGVFLP